MDYSILVLLALILTYQDSQLCHSVSCALQDISVAQWVSQGTVVMMMMQECAQLVTTALWALLLACQAQT